MPATLRLHTLGSVRLEADGQLCLGPGKPLALLIFLACSPFPLVVRDQLIDMLWVDVPPERARQTLRQTIWQLRRLLGANAIVNEDDGIRLALPIVIDRNEFMDAVQRRDFLTAVGRYHGPFLPNFALPGAADFESWAEFERQRLHRAFVQAIESVIRVNLDSGRTGDALRAARVLRDADPDRESSWRLLLQASVAAGDQVGFTLEAAELASRLATEGRTPDPSTQFLLDRGALSESSAAHPGTRALVGELVGRESSFSSLLGAWDAVRMGHGRQLAIVANAGLGKTRLLRDVRRRAATGPGSVAYVRLPLADRDIAFSAVASVARALSELPGAIGIAPESAAVLVGLDPTLSSRYAVAPDASAPADVLRRRVFAVDDLIGAVTSERPLLLMIDDCHWADPDSRQVLGAIKERVAGHRLLLVWATRPDVPSASRDVESGSAVILEPLTLADVEALAASIARLPAMQECSEWISALHHAASGSPLLVLETLQLGLTERWIELSNSSWFVPDQARLLAELAKGSAVERRLALLGTESRELLLDLALAASPIAVELLPSANAQLATLEQAGFVRRVGASAHVAHDEIADALSGTASPTAIRASHLRLATALAKLADESRAGCVRAARHALAAAEHAAVSDMVTDLFARRLAIAKREHDVRSDRELAADLMGVDRDDIRVARLLATLPYARRIAGRSARRLALTSLLVCTALVTAGASWWNGRPAQLMVRVRPLALKPMTPAPLIEVQDRRGQVVESATDTVEATLVNCPSPLSGTRTVVAKHGVAEFHGLWTFAAADGCSLQFSSRGLKSSSVPLSSIESQHPTLRLLSASVNGAAIDPRSPMVTVHPGQELRGFFEFRYTDFWGGAAVLLAAVPSWGTPEEQFQTVVALGTPIENGGTADSVVMRAPLERGHYYVIFLFNAEPDGKWIASGTNWTVGHQIWHDGNDVQEWTVEQLNSARSVGSVQTSIVRARGVTTPDWVGATVVDVTVQ